LQTDFLRARSADAATLRTENPYPSFRRISREAFFATPFEVRSQAIMVYLKNAYSIGLKTVKNKEKPEDYKKRRV
jgi:hypothetical protein